MQQLKETVSAFVCNSGDKLTDFFSAVLHNAAFIHEQTAPTRAHVLCDTVNRLPQMVPVTFTQAFLWLYSEPI